jgi:tRNA(fMet)-specific endonuclease VapC
MESLIFDTTFLIDIQRERQSRQPGRAHQFLRSHAEKGAYLSVVAYGEYAEGFGNLEDPAFVSLVESFEILPITRTVAGRYGEITRVLRKSGQMIGANDLWIAAAALDCGFPLVTGNTDHFARVEGLQVLGY